MILRCVQALHKYFSIVNWKIASTKTILSDKFNSNFFFFYFRFSSFIRSRIDDVKMGNSLCKERVERAENSKSPIDRIIGRCAQVKIRIRFTPVKASSHCFRFSCANRFVRPTNPNQIIGKSMCKLYSLKSLCIDSLC